MFQVKRVTSGSYACYLNGAYVGSIEQNSEAIRYEDGKLHHYWNLKSVMYGYTVHCDRYYRDIRNMAEGYFVREIAESRHKCAESSCWSDAGEFGLCDSCQSQKDAREAYERNPMGTTECAKCGVSFNEDIDTEDTLCPACFWHVRHYRIPFVDYPSYVESLKDIGFDVPEPNYVYEFESHNFESFNDGRYQNVTLITTGFASPMYCISNTFREDAPMGFERHSSGVVNCYVKRPLLALPLCSGL